MFLTSPAKPFFIRTILLPITIFALGLIAPVTHAAVDTCTWDGSVNGNWSNGGNWSGCDNGGVPENGDSLTFPDGPTTLSTTNDISNLSIVNLSINGSGYTLGGANGVAFGGTSGTGLAINGSDNTLNLPSITLGGTGSKHISSGGSGTNTINSDVIFSVANNISFTTLGSTLRFNGDISGITSFTLNFDSVFSAGIIEFAGANTYNVISISVGGGASDSEVLVRCLVNECFGAATNPVLVSTAGGLDAIELAAAVDVANSLQIWADNPAGSLRTVDGITSATWSGAIAVLNSSTFITGSDAILVLDGDLGLSAALTLDGASEVVLNGGISSSNGSILSKVPLLSLNGSCNETADVIAEAGTVAVDSVDYDSCVFTGGGGTVTGNGEIGAVTGTSGFFSSGAPTGELIVNGDFGLSSSMTFNQDIGGTGAGIDYDHTVVTGNASLGDAILEIILVSGFTPAIGDSFSFLAVKGDITGTFAGLPDGTIIAVDGIPFRINYNLDPSGPDTVVLTVVDTSAAVEICSNGTDDDGDTNIDCGDTDCASDPACLSSGSETCDNGTDDDDDTFADCDDLDCSANPVCTASGVENCINGADEDGDGQIDCQDSDCASAQACQGTFQGGGCGLSASSPGAPLSWSALFLLSAVTLGGFWRRKIF